MTVEAPKDGARARLLFVVHDDEAEPLADAVDVLRQDGRYDVFVAVDNEDLLDRAVEDDKYDVIIADQRRLDTELNPLLEVCAEIFTRVILIGPANGSDREWPTGISVHGYMEEPYTIENMIEMVKDVLKARPKRNKGSRSPVNPIGPQQNRAHLRKISINYKREDELQLAGRSRNRRGTGVIPESRPVTFNPGAAGGTLDGRSYVSGMDATIVDHGAHLRTEGAVHETRPMAAPAPRRATDLLGQRLGDYRVETKLGGGAMGVVFLAKHDLLDMHVALKLLPNQFAHNEEYLTRFYREARACAKLDHPNIVRVLNVGHQGDQHYIAMQFVDGPTLRTALENGGPLPLEAAVDYLEQTLAGLAYAHSKQCIHRDIKPDNLMVTNDGVLKITDFGLARNVGGEEVTLTHTGQVMGTPAYMPIEQWDGESVDHRADLFATGTTFYHLLTGHIPYEGKTASAILRNLANAKATPIHQYRRDVPVGVAAILARLIARDKEARYQSAEAALADIAHWRNESGVQRSAGARWGHMVTSSAGQVPPGPAAIAPVLQSGIPTPLPGSHTSSGLQHQLPAGLEKTQPLSGGLTGSSLTGSSLTGSALTGSALRATGLTGSALNHGRHSTPLASYADDGAIAEAIPTDPIDTGAASAASAAGTNPDQGEAAAIPLTAEEAAAQSDRRPPPSAPMYESDPTRTTNHHKQAAGDGAV